MRPQQQLERTLSHKHNGEYLISSAIPNWHYLFNVLWDFTILILHLESNSNRLEYFWNICSPKQITIILLSENPRWTWVDRGHTEIDVFFPWQLPQVMYVSYMLQYFQIRKHIIFSHHLRSLLTLGDVSYCLTYFYPETDGQIILGNEIGNLVWRARPRNSPNN